MSIVKLNNQAVKNATAFGSISSLGSMVFIKKLTASSSATLSFVDGTDGVVLDNTYKEYLFTFNNIHPSTNDAILTFNMSVDSGSNYNVTKTSTYFRAYLSEDNNFQSFGYDTGYDLAQSTSFQRVSGSIGAGNDENFGGTLKLFNPSSTTFVKHFISQGATQRNAIQWIWNSYMAGYGNTTSSIDAVQFKMDSGNIDAGDICLYGIA